VSDFPPFCLESYEFLTLFFALGFPSSAPPALEALAFADWALLNRHGFLISKRKVFRLASEPSPMRQLSELEESSLAA